MTVSSRETRLRRLSMAVLPFLIVVGFITVAWRNAENYLQSAELQTREGQDSNFAGAIWTLNKSRLIGDGKDTKIILPNGMRLVIVRLSTTITEPAGDRRNGCRFTLIDNKGRQWLPLPSLLSSEVSRDIEPDITPVEGCWAVAGNRIVMGASTLVEEKFIVPAEAVKFLEARLSFATTRPKTISFPLNFK